MQRLFSLRLLVACLLVFSSSAPSLASTMSWFCDGRLCGAFLCCCEQPDQSKTDENCKKAEPKAAGAELCETGCGCTPVFTAANELSDTLKPAIVSLALPELCPAPPPVLLAPVVYLPLVLVYRPDYRGPPIAQPTPLPSGLRAPPAS